MTWRSRRRKRFFRYTKSLEKAEMFLVDQYIVIDEYAGGRPKSHYDCKRYVTKNYNSDLRSGRIKSSLDFDNYYNPDLTLVVMFEENEEKANSIIEKTLHQIGKSWEKRLKELFPKHKYTLVMYFDSVSSDWFLDFYNGTQLIKDPQNSDRYKEVYYFNP